MLVDVFVIHYIFRRILSINFTLKMDFEILSNKGFPRLIRRKTSTD